MTGKRTLRMTGKRTLRMTRCEKRYETTKYPPPKKIIKATDGCLLPLSYKITSEDNTKNVLLLETQNYFCDKLVRKECG
jgi:hypothetical protein